MDDIYIEINISPSSVFTSSAYYDGDHGNARIQLSFRVQCSSNYYGSNCGTYCVSTDSSGGHYTCGSNGEKRCRTGWSNPPGNCLTRTFWSQKCMATYIMGGYITVGILQMC